MQRVQQLMIIHVHCRWRLMYNPINAKSSPEPHGYPLTPYHDTEIAHPERTKPSAKSTNLQLLAGVLATLRVGLLGQKVWGLGLARVSGFDCM